MFVLVICFCMFCMVFLILFGWGVIQKVVFCEMYVLFVLVEDGPLEGDAVPESRLFLFDCHVLLRTVVMSYLFVVGCDWY